MPNLLKLASEHYWDSLEKDKDLILLHLKGMIESYGRSGASVRCSDLLSADDIRKDERTKVWVAINNQIKIGGVSGDGLDERAFRNGMIKATNIICELGT